MRAVNIGIGHNDDFVVSELGNIKILMNACSKCSNHCLDLCISVNPVKSCLLHIQDLAAKRQNRLCGTGTRCFCGTTCGITLDDKDLTFFRVLVRTICQLSRKRHPVKRGFSSGQVTRLLGCISGSLRQNRLVNGRLTNIRVLLEEQRQLI